MKRVFCLLLVAVMMVMSLVACEATTPTEEEEPLPVVAEPLPVIEESTTPGVMPPVHFKLSDTYIQLLGDKLSKYNRELAFYSHWSPWTMTVVTGSTIPFIVSASTLNDMDHSLTIEGTDIDVTVGPGEAAGPFEVTFDELGTFKVDCGLHPGEHGECLIVVEEPSLVEPLPLVWFTLGNVDGSYLQVESDEDMAPFAGVTSGQKGPWTLTIVKGSTLEFRVEAAGRPGTVDHSLTIEGTDLDVNVTGPGGVSDYFEVTFDELGKFKLDCSLHPGEHGDCFIEVVETMPVEEEEPPVEEEEPPPVVEGPMPPIYFTIGTDYIRLKGDDLATYGFTGAEQDPPWTITIAKGTTITITDVTVSGKPGTGDHTFTIQGTDIDESIPQGTIVGPFEWTFDEVGTFTVSCTLHDHGECLIVVAEPTTPVVEEPPVEEEEPPVVAGPMPPISFKLADTYIRLIGDDLTPYGLIGTEQDSPWTITIAKGSTITITEVFMGGHPTAVDHIFAIEGTDIEVPLSPSVSEGPFEVTFNEVGTFKVYCKLRSADTYGGECVIVVEEPAPTMAKYKCTLCPYVYDPELGDPDGGIKPGTPFEEIPDDWVCPVCKVDKSKFEVVEEPPVVEEEPTPEVTALPPIALTIINADNGGILLQGDDLAPYGFPGEESVPSPWTITIKKGSTITITIGVSGHPASGDHHLIIEGTDVDVELGVGEVLPPRELTFNEVGTFKVYSENLPDELQCTIVVEE